MFKVDSNFSDLYAKLDRLENYVTQLPIVAVKSMSFIGVLLSKGFVRVRTGSLQSSIRTIPVKVDGDRITGGWTAGGYITNPITGKIVDYQIYQEFYCPYMRPAADIVGADAVSYFTQASVVSVV